MLEDRQILESINIGIVTIDRDMVVGSWNRWMAFHSGTPAEDVVGKSILELYPHLSKPLYQRFIGSVLTFGTYACFSQKLHRHLFPMPNPHSSADAIPLMQQSCTAGPTRGPDGAIVGAFIAVVDVTDSVAHETRLRQKVGELEAAVAKVQQLEGIIPICMYCKKIRDDDESWQQLERYISEHSDARFSHGICPDCYPKWRQR